MAENLQLDGYTDLSRIGRGGMATVYRGHQTSLDRTVAIKFLSAEHLWDHQAQELFDQESLVIAQLNHPNIIHIIDRGFTSGGRPYFVMEYVEGQALAEKMRQSTLTPLARVTLSMQICSGLAYAHHNGVIHRDIKPANLLIDDEGHLRILDFGIAWLNASGDPDGNAVLGTPDYMSPEQFSAPEKVSHLSDIYALGAVMYQLFVGKKHVDDIKGWQAGLTSLQPQHHGGDGLSFAGLAPPSNCPVRNSSQVQAALQCRQVRMMVVTVRPRPIQRATVADPPASITTRTAAIPAIPPNV